MLELISEFSKAAGCKVNIHNSIFFMIARNNWKKKFKQMVQFATALKTSILQKYKLLPKLKKAYLSGYIHCIAQYCQDVNFPHIDL